MEGLNLFAQIRKVDDGEIFYTLKEAQVLVEEWRLEYNTFRPHSSLKYRPLHRKYGCTECIKNGRTLTLNVVHVPGVGHLGLARIAR